MSELEIVVIPACKVGIVQNQPRFVLLSLWKSAFATTFAYSRDSFSVNLQGLETGVQYDPRVRDTGCEIWIANSLFLTLHLTSSDSLKTPARYTSRYSDTIKVSLSSSRLVMREETEEGDETLNEGLEVSEEGRWGPVDRRILCKEYMGGYVEVQLGGRGVWGERTFCSPPRSSEKVPVVLIGRVDAAGSRGVRDELT